MTFEFSEAIQYFQLDISFVLPPDEFISEFNIGLPNELTDTLGIVDGVVTSLVAGDNGFGSLIWTGVNTTTVSFVIGNLPDSVAQPALAIDQFAITEVPLPPAFFMMISGIIFLNLLNRSRRRQ